MQHRSPLTLARLLAAVSLLVAGQLSAAEPKNAPAKVERIEGTALSRVTLTEQAVERLGIATVELREMAVVRKRLVSGLAITPVATTTATLGELQNAVAGPASLAQPAPWIIVQPVGELDKTARGRPARVLPLTETDDSRGWWAEPAAVLAVPESSETPNRPLVFVVRATTTLGIPALGPVFVELAFTDDDMVHPVAPYDAVLYDIRGDAWVYTSPEPHVFVRHPIVVEYIDKGLAVLSQGPPPGIKIVVVGVAELYGTEFKIGK